MASAAFCQREELIIKSICFGTSGGNEEEYIETGTEAFHHLAMIASI